MIQAAFTCLYCDHKWKAWVSEGQVIPKCSICQESKMIKFAPVDDEKRDVFGYRFDPKPSIAPEPVKKPADPVTVEEVDTSSWTSDGGTDYLGW